MQLSHWIIEKSRKRITKKILKGTWYEIVNSVLDLSSPRIIPNAPFRLFSKFCQEICNSWCTTGVSENGNDIGGIWTITLLAPVASLQLKSTTLAVTSLNWFTLIPSAGIFKQSRNRVGIRLSHWPTRLHRLAVLGLLKSSKIQAQDAGGKCAHQCQRCQS